MHHVLVMSKRIRVFMALATAVIISASLGGCGWQLRGFDQGALPDTLALDTQDRYAPIARQLQQTLNRRGVTLSSTAPIRLWLDQERQEKRAVAVTNIGSAAQYELHLTVSFKYIREHAQPQIANTVSTQRIFDFIPGSNLAKDEEEQTLLKEMRQELINRILTKAPKKNSYPAQARL